jgi:predicted O-linked N-acetylglucosamine transferase (SPINDLY family)
VPQALEQAVKFHQQGQLGDAERLYREVLRTSPRDFDALHLLGVLKLQQGQPEEALRLTEAALEVDISSPALHSNRGIALASLKRHDEALASFDRALAIDGRNPGALCNRADTLCDLGRPAEALTAYDQALAIEPRLVSALVNRGLALRDIGRPAEALGSYDKALAAEPNDVEALNNRGVALRDLGRYADALASYDRALALRPNYVDALFNRGNALLALKRQAEAIVSYGKALALRPAFADAYNNRGNAQAQLGAVEDALASYDRALAIDPQLRDAKMNRAGLLQRLGRFDQAISAYLGLRAEAPDLPNLAGDLAQCYAEICDWPGVAAVRTALLDDVAAARPVDPFSLLEIESTPAQQLACAENWLRAKKISSAALNWNPADFAGDKIRVAYLSADFHQHVTANVLAELFERHDRDRFEIFGISYGPDDGSAMRSRLIKSFDRFFDVSKRTDADIAKLVRDLKAHIAVDLKGHTRDGRIGVLAQRAAPIQVNYMGFPGTLGADFIDYVIADEIVLPLDQQPFFKEKIVHLPGSYYVRDTTQQAAPRSSRSEWQLPDGAFVFCGFNNSWKVGAGMFDIWMRLLRDVERSVLVLFAANPFAVDNLRKEAAARGIDAGRLVFWSHADLPQHLARLKLADVFLDTLPYNAHTTATDALWVGLPVVTCAGATFPGRVGGSLVSAVGVPELIVDDLQAYEALALKLARDPDLLRSLRQKIERNRTTQPLFDTDRFRRSIEQAYATMREIWQRGESPRGFAVEPIEP